MSDENQISATPLDPSIKPIKSRNLKYILRYLFKKIILITLTIFLGTFITVLVINRDVQVGVGKAPAQLDQQVRTKITQSANYTMMNRPGGYSDTEMKMLIAEMEEESGINKPLFQKTLIYTINSMTFDWGKMTTRFIGPHSFSKNQDDIMDLNGVILTYLPATMLLVVTSYLIIIVFGLPIALSIAQKRNAFVDKLISFISPISSIPSWVIGLLLTFIFAIELKWLPARGILDTLPPDTKIGYIPIVLKHMILPVSAIVISLIFQLVNTWRSVFLTFGEEDYVDLGISMGLPPRKFKRQYILKPTLPFVITSISLMLISFWQMTMALEVVFQWQGIGFLFITSGLPNYWGESMFPGNLIISLSLIVLFAYITGIVVFVLDLVYVIVDPRIRIMEKAPILKSIRSKTKRSASVKMKSAITSVPRIKPEDMKANDDDKAESISSLKIKRYELSRGFSRFFRDIKNFPSAIVGMIMILLLLAGSIYAMVGLPYKQIGAEWGRTSLSGKVSLPKLAQPAWINAFRAKDYLSTSIMTSDDEGVKEVISVADDGSKRMTMTFEFDYQYADIPSDIYLYLDSTYENKTPFISVKWITPDEREINLKGMAVTPGSVFLFEEHIPAKRWVAQNDNWKNWFNFTKIFPTPFHYLLFASPDASQEAEIQNGTYKLVLDGFTFEENSDIDAEFVLLGKVYGAAGTDYYRRDLLVPLMWGMPFALVIGLIGSVLTTVLSMIIAAAGVWFGGWVDDLVQLITEVNLILPMLAITVLAYAYLHINIWLVLAFVILLNVFGSPTKNFRAAFMQIKDAPYIEASKAYGASNFRIIIRYMFPRIIPILVPQLIILVPSFVFLEATLGLFNINTGLPTWGTVIYQAMTKGAMYGSRFWVLEPLALLLLTGVAFSLFGTALERLLNPRLLEK